MCLFHGNNIVVNRLTAVNKHNFSIRELVLNKLVNSFSVLAVDVCTVDEGDKCCVAVSKLLGKLVCSLCNISLSESKLAVFENKKLALFDVVSLIIGITGSKCNLTG